MKDEMSRAQMSADSMRVGDAALRFCGIQVEDVAPGRASGRMTVTDEMVNGYGLAHGGFVFLLADTAFAYACNTDGTPTVARQCEISFLRPAYAGDELVALAELRTRAGSTGIYDVRVSRDGGEIVAELRGHSATLKARKTDR